MHTYATFNTAALRLERQMNPAQVDRTKWDFNLALSSPRGWGESDLDLSESLEWLRKYLCDLQDTMQWQDQACGWTVMHAIGEAAGSICRYDSMKCVVIEIDPAKFIWPILPTDLVTGLSHVVERLAQIADSAGKIFHPQDPSRSVEFSPSALAAELGVSEGTLNKYAKAAGVETPARGAKNHRYSVEDAVRICEQFATSSGEKKTREKAKSLLGKLTKTET